MEAMKPVFQVRLLKTDPTNLVKIHPVIFLQCSNRQQKSNDLFTMLGSNIVRLLDPVGKQTSIREKKYQLRSVSVVE